MFLRSRVCSWGLILALFSLVSVCLSQDCSVAEYCKPCSCHGKCRSDGLCMCDPDFFDSNCTQEIITGQLSDGGYWGFIVAWVLLLPLVGVCCVYGCKSVIDGDVGLPNLNAFNIFANRPPRSQSGAIQIQETPSVDRVRSIRLANLVAHSDTSPAATPSFTASNDPPNSNALIDQVMQIMGPDVCSRDRAREVLRENNWQMSATMQALVGN
eukprot:gb/GEZN01017438.1/.p1 GENE.gb/GEZN01017438.1/~~gb/GEZN01017438.1/.p1  ORF type:complete len:212 (-),score=4.24 gb/GEZN01017438.1/:119-754(-)